MVMIDLDSVPTQAAFGELVGVSQQAISDLARSGHLPEGGSVRVWLLAYYGRLRAVAAGRGSDGELDLVQERAQLAREQRISQALKNAVSRREFAPIGLLSEVLASASQSVAAQLEALPGQLHKIAPDMTDEARDAIARAVAAARNGWVSDTANLQVAEIAGPDDVEGDDADSTVFDDETD